jgi:hypothetical protein
MKTLFKTSSFALAAMGLLAACTQPAYAGSTLGGVIENLIDNTWSIPGMLSGFSYMAGLVFGFMFILKLKDHIEGDRQVPLWDPMKRAIVAGCFFSLPTVISAVILLVDWEGNGGAYQGTGFNTSGAGEGLDGKLVMLMADVFGPAQFLFGWFGYIAGTVLVMIGILRLMKTEQEGARGPTGIGTIATFIVAGCLFSLNAMIAYFSATLFGDSTIETAGTLVYDSGLGTASPHIHAVISSIVAFSILLGWISIIRGFFIFRGVSEGNSQASMMAAVTHLIGGAMAVNLGPMIMVVQETLGITEYGIRF